MVLYRLCSKSEMHCRFTVYPSDPPLLHHCIYNYIYQDKLPPSPRLSWFQEMVRTCRLIMFQECRKYVRGIYA